MEPRLFAKGNLAKVKHDLTADNNWDWILKRHFRLQSILAQLRTECKVYLKQRMLPRFVSARL